jgi:hypothetical protein
MAWRGLYSGRRGAGDVVVASEGTYTGRAGGTGPGASETAIRVVHQVCAALVVKKGAHPEPQGIGAVRGARARRLRAVLREPDSHSNFRKTNRSSR